MKLNDLRLVVLALILLSVSLGCGKVDNGMRGSWSRIEDGPEQRMLHTAVWTGDSMLVWGGYEPSPLGYTIKNTGKSYNPKTKIWTDITADGAPSARAQHSAIWTGKQMIIWGGIDADRKALGDGSIFDSATGKWRAISSTNAPAARMRHVAVWTDTKMIVWGGKDSDGKWLGSGAVYDLAADTWTTIAVTNAPVPAVALADIPVSLPTIDEDEARAKINTSANDAVKKAIGFYITDLVTPWSNAVWVPTVSKMFLIGGLSLGLGAAYDPATNTWEAIGAPVSLSWSPFSPPAVWTGSRVFTWDKGQGALYDPAEKKWTLASTVGQLSKRYQHTMTVAGDQTILWGGMVTSTGRRKGSFYYPLTDTWEDTQTEDAPVGRYFHTSVWTGEVLIVWGGIPLAEGDDSLVDWAADPLGYNKDKSFKGGIYSLVKPDSGSKPADPPPERKVHCPLGSKASSAGICIKLGEVTK